MSHPTDSLAARLGPVARLRREQAGVRAFVAAVGGAAFLWGLHEPAVWAWLTVYAAAQALEVWALLPFGREGARDPSRGRTACALLAIMLLAGAFGSLSLLLVYVPGQLGVAAAVLVLSSGLLNLMSTSRGCPEAYAAGAAAYAAVLLVLVLRLAPTAIGHDPQAWVMLIAAVGFLLTALLIWREGETHHRRERATLRELDRKRREAEAAWEARQSFVAAVSHELRTPLGAITAASGALEACAPTAEARGRASLIADAARLMRRLLDDLLDLARLEAGRMSVESVAFDPGAVVRESAALWRAPAEAKGLALALDGVDRLPTSAKGDPLRLRQVLNNLLSNAVKFTESGEVRLCCGSRAAPGGWELELHVVDTGPGLPEEVLARLFQPFAQAGPQTARLHGGSGLGLAISRELARLMGGSLAARRGAGGRGAVFSLHLRLDGSTVETAPAESGAGPAAAAQAALQAASPFARTRLLVVDDHPLGRRALRALMEAADMEVTEAAGGGEALALLAVQRFDMVLMDLTMPGMDGCEAVRRLRGGGGPNADAAVLGVTGHTGPETARACREAGMDGHVEKPCEPQVLYAAVHAALEARAPQVRPALAA